MASAYRCICDSIVRTNPFEGNSVHLLIEEKYFIRDDNLTAVELENHVDLIFDSATKVMVCNNCKRLAVIDDHYRVEYYEKIELDEHTKETTTN